MPFPVSIRGRFRIARSVGCEDVTASVIEKAKDTLWELSDHVEIVEQSIISTPSLAAWFTAPGGRSHPMVPFDDVRLTVTGDETEAVVTYDLSTHRMLIIVGMMAVIIVVGGEVASIGHQPPLAALDGGLKFAAGAFAWLFGVNFLLGWIRGPRWLRKKLSS